jgi:hypothetical protein
MHACLPCVGGTAQVKEDVLPFCCYSERSRMFTAPADVAAWRVVVATCGAAGEQSNSSAVGVHVPP